MGKFRIKKTKNGDFIVINKKTNTHAHFATIKGCKDIIFFITHDIEPYNPYFIESKRRLLGERI